MILKDARLAKKSLWFSSKNKRQFSFSPGTLLNKLCSINSGHFSGYFIISSSQNFLSFWAKNSSRCLLQSSKELKYFPLREFCKDLMKLQYLVNTTDESVLPSQAIIVFVWSSKKHVVLHYHDGRLCIFLLTNSGHFLLRTAFSWSNWEQCLLELIVFFFRRSS